MLLIWSGIVPLLTCHLPQCPVVRNDRWVSSTGPLLSETVRNRDEEATSDEQGFPTQATAACWKAWQPRQSLDHDPQWCHPPSRQRLRMDIHRLSRYITRNCPSPGYVISPVPHVWNKLANTDDCNGHFAHKTFAPLYQSSHSENMWKSVQMSNWEWWEFKVYECENDSTENKYSSDCNQMTCQATCYVSTNAHWHNVRSISTVTYRCTLYPNINPLCWSSTWGFPWNEKLQIKQAKHILP